VAASGSDDDLDSRFFGEAQCGAIADADLAIAVEQGSVHVDGDDAW
jgi:hypothetical protein